MMSGLAPGNVAEMLMVGKSTCGKGAVGNCKKATSPARATAAVSSTVAIGRRMNGAEMFMPVQARRDHPCYAPQRASGGILRVVHCRRMRGRAVCKEAAPD